MIPILHSGVAQYHPSACSGSITLDLTRPDIGQSGEVPQLQQGWLDENTTHVSLSIGGNDAGFADVVKGCLLTIHNCLDSSFHLTRTNEDGSTTVDAAALVDEQPARISSEFGTYAV